MATPQQQQANQVGAGLSNILNSLSNTANQLSPANLINQGFPLINPSNIGGILNPVLGVGQGAAQNTGTPNVSASPSASPPNNAVAWSPILQTLNQLSPLGPFGQAVNWATTPTVTNGPGYTGPNDPDPAHKTTTPSPAQQVGTAVGNFVNQNFNANQPNPLQPVVKGVLPGGGNGGGTTVNNPTVNVNPPSNGFGVASGGTAQPGATAVNAGQTGAYANYQSPYANQAALSASGTPSWLSGQSTMASPLQSNPFGAQTAQPGFGQTAQPFGGMGAQVAQPGFGQTAQPFAPQTTGSFPMVPPAPSQPLGNSAQGALATAGMAPAPNQPVAQPQSYEAQFIAAMIGGQQVTDQNGNVIADFSMVPANVRQSILSSIMQGAGPTAVPGVGTTPQSTGGFGTSPQPAPRYNPQNNPNSPAILQQAAQAPAGGLPSSFPSTSATSANTAQSNAQQQQYLANKYPQIAGNPQALAAFGATPVQGNNGFDYVPGFGVIPYQDILSSKGNPLQGQYLLSHLDKLVRSGALQAAQQAGAPVGIPASPVAPVPSAYPTASAPATIPPNAIPSIQQLQALMPNGASMTPGG